MSCDDLARAHIVEGFLTVSIVLIRFCSFLHLGFFHFLLSFFLSLMHFAYIKWDISPKSCIEKLLMGIFSFNLITVFSNGFPSVSQCNAILASHLLFSNISYSCFFFLSGFSATRAAPTHKKLLISLDSGLRILKILSSGRSLIDT